MTRRFYHSAPLPAALEGMGDSIELDEAESHHLLRVMRAETGTDLELFDGRGTIAEGTLTGHVGKRALVRLTRVWNEPPPSGRLVLATAVPKGDRFAWLVEKATELGVARLVPLVTRRSVVDPGMNKLEKLRGAVIEACKQCRRSTLMTIDDPLPFDRWLAQHSSVVGAKKLLVAHPGGNPLVTCWRGELPSAECTFVIGPEGGLTDEEVSSVTASGGEMVSLGSYLLRVETAAVAVAAWHRLMAEGTE